MAWVTRGCRGYSYRSIRRGGRVTSVYVGSGIPAEAAEFLRASDRADRDRVAAEREAWAAEREGLNKTERRIIEIDGAYDDLATLAMLATGHHKPKRGRWRKKRKTVENEAMSDQSNQVKPARPRLATAAEIASLFDRLDAAKARGDDPKPQQRAIHQAAWDLRVAAQAGVLEALPGLRSLLDRRPGFYNPRSMEQVSFEEAATLTCAKEDLLGQELVIRELRGQVDELAGPEAPLLERLLAERVVLARYDAYQADLRANRGAVKGQTFEQADHASRQQSRAQARFLAAAKSLATVRRLALPVLHVHRAEEAPAQPATPNRLKVVSDA